MGCQPPPPPYECKALAEELDFREVETFTRKSLFVPVDFRDRPDLSVVNEPFTASIQSSSSPVSEASTPLFLSVDFTPNDARLHVDELRVRLSRQCEEQTVRLRGLGSGALETPSLEIAFGSIQISQTVERTVPFTNTRREPREVWSSWAGINGIEVTPQIFSLQPAERREVSVRVTCSQLGPLSDSIDVHTREQKLTLRLTGECLP